MRYRAGHAWTGFCSKNNKTVHLLLNDAGIWITTGEAQGWRRCPRCRVPFENDPFDSGLCSMCYFYKSGLSIDDFWRLNKEGYYLAPYVIGSKTMKAVEKLDWNKLRNGNWRQALKAQRVA